MVLRILVLASLGDVNPPRMDWMTRSVSVSLVCQMTVCRGLMQNGLDCERAKRVIRKPNLLRGGVKSVLAYWHQCFMEGRALISVPPTVYRMSAKRAKSWLDIIPSHDIDCHHNEVVFSKLKL